MSEREGSASVRAPAERAGVIAVLRRHGIPGTVAAELWRVAGDLRRRTRRRGVEHAVTLDAESGQTVGPMLTGTTNSTDLSTHLFLLHSDRKYVQLHTHPRSTSLSQLDLLVFAENDPISVMVVVGADGSWHVLSRAPDSRRYTPRALFDDCIQERLRLQRQQTLPEEIPHLAIEVVASRHHLRYDRIVGSTDE